ELNARETFISEKEKNISKLNKNLSTLENKIDILNAESQRLDDEINQKYDTSLVTIYKSVIIPNIDETSSSEIKNKLSLLKIKEKDFILDGAINIPSYLNNREANNIKKKMLIPLESEITGLLNKLTISNVDSTREKIIRTFDKINKLFKNDEAEFKKELLELKLQELELNYSYIVKVNDEKEQQKAIKEQMIEEEKVRREIEREKKRIDKEERQFNSEITKLMAYMQKASADVEKELYADKIKELEEKLRELETVKEDVLQRELNTRAGYVYVISNIGSFGEDVYKIGMTRRLEPMDRIKELSSASVPFEFDVHAMIFSEDAPTLENQLHSHFRKNEVNKVNQRKEFFKVSLDEIEKVVLENYNGTVSFTKLAQAEQYRRSLELTDV
ncbi:TPA: DUF4041 domain-containing protein, partial [Enterococcus faecium]